MMPLECGDLGCVAQKQGSVCQLFRFWGGQMFPLVIPGLKARRSESVGLQGILNVSGWTSSYPEWWRSMQRHRPCVCYCEGCHHEIAHPAGLNSSDVLPLSSGGYQSKGAASWGLWGKALFQACLLGLWIDNFMLTWHSSCKFPLLQGHQSSWTRAPLMTSF